MAHLDPWRLAHRGGVFFSKELSALPPSRVEKGLGGGGITKTYHEHRVPRGKGWRTSDRPYPIFTVSQENVAAENGSVHTMHSLYCDWSGHRDSPSLPRRRFAR